MSSQGAQSLENEKTGLAILMYPDGKIKLKSSEPMDAIRVLGVLEAAAALMRAQIITTHQQIEDDEVPETPTEPTS